MSESAMGAIAAGAAVFFLAAFAQTARSMTTNVFSSVVSVLSIPLGIAAMWRLALAVGWWSVAVFIGASLLAGGFHAMVMGRNRERVRLWRIQPFEAAAALGLTALSWLLR